MKRYETGSGAKVSDDAINWMRTALEAAGVEFLGTVESLSLSALIVRWLAADGSRIKLFGVDPGTTPEQATDALLSDRYADVIRPAKNLIEIFEDATDPIG